MEKEARPLARPGFCCVSVMVDGLEDELQAELQDAGKMSSADLAKWRTAPSSGVIGAACASHRVRYASARSVVGERELRMIEDVKSLRTELKCHVFLDREVLKNPHVKVEPRGVADIVSASIAKGESLRQSEGARVEIKFGVTRAADLTRWRDAGIGVANTVRV